MANKQYRVYRQFFVSLERQNGHSDLHVMLGAANGDIWILGKGWLIPR